MRQIAPRCTPTTGYFGGFSGFPAQSAVSDTGAGFNSQANRAVASRAPANWAAMKPGAWPGAMPEKVSVKERAMVTAGLAYEVEAVNQEPAVMN